MKTIHKSEDFEGMRKAGNLAARTLDLLVDHVKPGVSTQELDRIAFNFIDSNRKTSLSSNLNNHIYQQGINKLIIETFKAFPKSKIKIIQQGMPGCKFIDENTFIDRHGQESKICLTLANVHLNIDKSVKKIQNNKSNKISVYKMYLHL